MPLPDRLARINRRVTNPILRTVAGRLPGMAIVGHRGRRTGRNYRTPVNAFRTGSGFVIALTYGAQRDWVTNVLAGGGCTLERMSHSIELREPRMLHGEDGSRLIPAAVRPLLRMLGVSEFLFLTPSGAGADDE